MECFRSKDIFEITRALHQIEKHSNHHYLFIKLKYQKLTRNLRTWSFKISSHPIIILISKIIWSLVFIILSILILTSLWIPLDLYLISRIIWIIRNFLVHLFIKFKSQYWLSPRINFDLSYYGFIAKGWIHGWIKSCSVKAVLVMGTFSHSTQWA